MRFDYADRRGYADTKIGQIHYVEAGSGDTPILLLHQTSSSSGMYARSMRPFARSHWVIAIDTPGFGMSDPPPGPPGDMSYYAQAVVGLLDHVSADRAHIVGVRTGASIAMEVAAEYQDRVASVTIGLILSFLSDAENSEWRSLNRSASWTPDTDNTFLTEHVLDYVARFATPGDGETYLRELIAKLQAGPDYWWAYRAVLESDGKHKADRVVAPTLVLNAKDDISYEYTKRAHEAIPHSEYVEIPGPVRDEPGWFAVMAEYPEQFASAVVDFIARHPTTRSK